MQTFETTESKCLIYTYFIAWLSLQTPLGKEKSLWIFIRLTIWFEISEFLSFIKVILKIGFEKFTTVSFVARGVPILFQKNNYNYLKIRKNAYLIFSISHHLNNEKHPFLMNLHPLFIGSLLTPLSEKIFTKFWMNWFFYNFVKIKFFINRFFYACLHVKVVSLQVANDSLPIKVASLLMADDFLQVKDVFL